MYKIGITGSIGTGKTTVANIFALFKVPIFDADREIKKILKREEIKTKISVIWPSTIKNNDIDKLKLRSIIFSNNKEKKKLEKILYPYLQIEKDKFDKTYHNEKILIYDVPLIYETKTQKNYDLILLTYCDLETQRKRVTNRDNISNSLFKKIVQSQLSIRDKMRFKPQVINTSSSKLVIFTKIFILLIKVLTGAKIK